jgi:opacity protein-like surface antigen
MKSMLMVAALAAFLAPASIGSAVAQENYGSAGAGYDCNRCGPAIAEPSSTQWLGSAPRRKTYAWPDQRYYGAHGMLSD